MTRYICGIITEKDESHFGKAPSAGPHLTHRHRFNAAQRLRDGGMQRWRQNFDDTTIGIEVLCPCTGMHADPKINGWYPKRQRQLRG